LSVLTRARDVRAKGYAVTLSGVLATLRLARRSGGAFRVLALTRTRLVAHRSARIEIGPGERLLIGGGAQRVLGIPGAHTTLRLEPGATLRVQGRARLGLGARVRIGRSALLSFGDDTYVGANFHAQVFDRVEIGSGCAVSWDVTILDTNMHQLVGEPAGAHAVTVGNNVWIGFGATILPGVTIGNGAVVAAKAVVASDVPAGALVAGSPARVVRTDVEWRR
jgi:acetyltransferase-like isoleucine patch superfamily enzyme